MPSLEDLDEGYFNHIHELISFGEGIGVPIFFWDTFFDLQEILGIGLVADYFFVQEEGEWVRVKSDMHPSETTNKVRSGAKIGCQWSVPFSKEWYVCQASDYLRKCYSGDVEERVRASFHFGKAVAEAQWKARTEAQLQEASTISSIRKRAGASGGTASRNRRLAFLELFMREIEKLSEHVGTFSEDRIVQQALEAARTREPKMPSSRKTLDNYSTALRSEEPFKSRYEAVFRKKNA